MSEGFKQHVAAENQLRADMMDTLQQEAIGMDHNRTVLSPEVQALNNRAELIMFGTHGRTEGYVDPTTGDPLTQPIKGKVDLIREDFRIKSVPERNAKADKYVKDVEDLMTKGYVDPVTGREVGLESSQALLVMDERDRRTERVEGQRKLHQKLVMQYMDKGMTAGEASQVATKRLKPRLIDEAKEDQEFKDKIHDEGIFSPSGLRPQPSPRTPEEIERETTMRHLNVELNNARDEYARLSAGRGRRAYHFAEEYQPKAVEQARQKYEGLRRTILRQEMRRAHEAGVSPENLDRIAETFAIADADRTANSLFNRRLEATGRYAFANRTDAHGNRVRVLQEVKPKTILGRAAGAFYDWYGRQENSKFFSTATLKKGAAMIAIGLPVGAVAGLAGTVVLGPAGGAAGLFVAHRLAKSKMASHISKRSHTTHAANYDNQLRAVIHNGDGERITEMIDAQTRAEVKANRIRSALALGSAALGGVGAEIGVSHLLGGHAHNAHPVSHGKPEYTGTPDTNTDNPLHPAHAPIHPPHHTHTGHHGATQQAELGHSGDNISDEVAKTLHEHGYALTQHNIDHLTNATLHANGLSGHQPNELPIGYKFGIPLQAMEELSKEK